MTARPIRLLMTCRDTNGAHQIVQLAAAALRRENITLTLLADEVGLTRLRSAGLPVLRAGIPVIAKGDVAGWGRALAPARALLAQYSPDAVVTSYSGPNAGIDEAMVAVAAPAATFLLQDFWGDINPGFGRLAGTVFVLDAAAEALTRQNHAVRTVVTGMPKFEAYAHFDVAEMRAHARQKLGIGGAQPVLGFFGQPLWNFDAYRSAVAEFMAAVREFRAARVLLRPHPRDESGELERAAQALAVAGIETHVAGKDAFGRIEDVLAACDVACSAYSSSCHDMIVMNRVAREPAGRALYYVPEGIMRVYREEVGHDAIPPVDSGLALVARNSAELVAALTHALAPASRTAAWRHVRETSPEVEGASDRILDEVLASVGEQARVA